MSRPESRASQAPPAGARPGPGLGHRQVKGQSLTVNRCEQCGVEFFVHPPFAASSWLRIVYDAIKRLHDEEKPHRKYYHYKHDICNYIDKHWNSLCPEKKRTLTWNNTVSAVITTHRKLFKSNRKQSGYWTLRPTTPGARTESDSDDDDELLNLDEGGISALTKKKPPKQKRASTAPSSSLGYSGSPGHKKRAHSDMSEGYGPGGNGGGGRRNVYRFEPRIPFSARRRHRQNPSYRTAMVILAENVAANGDTQPISDSTPMESNNPDTVSDQPLPSSTAASSLSGGGDFSGSASGGGANASRKLRSSTSEEDPLYIVPVPPHWVERIQRHPFLTATFASNDILIPSWRSVDVDDETVPADEGEEEEEDLSDAHFETIHNSYEQLERKIKRWG